MEYILKKKYINSDFINTRIKKAKSIIIKENEIPKIIVREKEKENTIIEIAIDDIINVSIINQKQYRKTDKLIQLVYTNDSKKIKIIRLNIQDQQIEEFINEIRKFKECKTLSKTRNCFKCNTKYDYKILYCDICNYKLQVMCTMCGRENSTDSLICIKCLIKLIEIGNADNSGKLTKYM